MNRAKPPEDSVFYFIGGGIASMAGAAFLIRDGAIKGHNITILEESAAIGGSLDASGSPETGYRMRGGRMLESKYLCTFDLFSSVPTLDGRTSVTQEIFEWNKTIKTFSHARLVRGGKSVDAPAFGLLEKHILSIERLALLPEDTLGRSSIEDRFDESFFRTDFWFMWCSTFAFQPWHSAIEFKRYLLRFTHMVSGFNTLSGIMRTVYNQYDSLVRPLRKWLEDRGVQFTLSTRVTDLDLCHDSGGYKVERIRCESTAGLAGEDRPSEIWVRPGDRVFVTLGSMTEASSFGAMDSVPVQRDKMAGGSWTLWEKLASRNHECGHPSNFDDHIDESQWVSFTATLRDPKLFNLIRDLTGNAPGEGGMITFPESSWLASIALPYQPHFIGQPPDVNVLWGYGLAVEASGNFVKKPMSACTGREIMSEILGHFGIHSESEDILKKCICIPCRMPFIASQFLKRGKGDRPQVIPERSGNLAFLGQFCELPDDVAFTVEYSVRTAQTAVYEMLVLDRKPPPMYKGSHDLRTLRDAILTLHGARVNPAH